MGGECVGGHVVLIQKDVALIGNDQNSDQPPRVPVVACLPAAVELAIELYDGAGLYLSPVLPAFGCGHT